MLQSAKVLEENFEAMRALIAEQVQGNMASGVGNGIAGVPADLEEAIARNEAGVRAQFAHAELTPSPT